MSQPEKKNIHLLSAVSIGVGGMIGAGIFSILGVAGAIAGPAVFLSFLIAGVVAMLCTYSFAKLGVTFPSAGGPVEFLVKGLGDTILSGGLNILLWIGYIFALALYANAFGEYAATFFSSQQGSFLSSLFAVLVILFFTGVNFIGARAVGRSEVFIVAVKVVILLLFAISGLFFIEPSHLSLSRWPAAHSIIFGAGVVFLAYEGFGLITNAAEDMETPSQTLPRALYTSVIFVGFVYVLVSITVMGNLTVSEVTEAKDYALAAAAKPFLGQVGFTIISVAALFSTASAINATLYGGANISYTLARHGELPAMFNRKLWGHAKEGLFITAGLVIFFAVFFKLEEIALLGSTVFLILYAMVHVAHFFLIKQTGARLSIIILSLAGCLIFLGFLIYYEITRYSQTLWALGVVTAVSFMMEWIYRKYSCRKIKNRC